MNFLHLSINLLSKAPKPQGSVSLMENIIAFSPFLILLVFFYFFAIRPQKKRQEAANKMRSELAIGDKVCTIGGLVGIIKKTEEDEVHLAFGNNDKLVIVKKWGISDIIK